MSAPEQPDEDVFTRNARLKAARATRSPFGERPAPTRVPSARNVAEARAVLAELDARRRAANMARAARAYRARRAGDE